MLDRLRRRIASSLRYKLIALVSVTVALVAPVSVGFVVYWSQGYAEEQLFRRVTTDLAVAHDAFERQRRELLETLERAAASHAFLSAYEAGDADRIRDQLATLRETTGFDFLHIADLHGRWMLRASEGDRGGSRWTPLHEVAASGGAEAVGIEVFDADELAAESPALAARARIPLLRPDGTASGEGAETRALVVRVVVPVRDLNGTIVALLDGGVVLNRDTALVDRVRDLVYGPGSLPRDAFGAATVFLGDVRIGTNVPLPGGGRAIGTRVSHEVGERVLGLGATWVDRAFVVDDWYISAYEPIVDVDGERVGMLYAGFLEAPFRAAWYRALAISLLLLVAGFIVAQLVAMRGARHIFEPIEAVAQVVRAIRAGEDRRIGPLASSDEIGALARQFDETLELLHERNEQVRLAALHLESQVDARTRELKAKNERLEQTIELLHETRQQLVAAEKLAALGELTAGVAHEINNPVAVIQGNLEVLRAELGDHVGAVETEIDLVMEQVERIHAIVDKLLSYSRPTRHANPGPVDLRRLLDDTLVLVDHEMSARSLAVERDYRTDTRVAVDPHELQQVLVNLLVNAAQASEPGGRVRVVLRDWGEHGVALEVTDDGCGIAPEHLGRVFDPFFTTKAAGGTGLGLSVSYGLVRRYGGDITVRSAPGAGTTFTVTLLRNPVLSPALRAAEPRPDATTPEAT